MKSLMLAAGLMIVGVSAEARVKSYELTCSEARSYVEANGAVILQTGTYTYDRYVAHRGYCSHNEVTRHAWVPTLDDASCLVGYVCRQHDNR